MKREIVKTFSRYRQQGIIVRQAYRSRRLYCLVSNSPVVDAVNIDFTVQTATTTRIYK